MSPKGKGKTGNKVSEPRVEPVAPSATDRSPESVTTSSNASRRSRRLVVWGCVDIALGLAFAWVIWAVLPARWMPVDVIGSIFALASIASGIGLVLGAPWARMVALATSAVTLVAGLALVTAVAVTASYLSGVYGPVGKGGGIILVFVALLLLPYMVLVPAAQIVSLRARPAGG